MESCKWMEWKIWLVEVLNDVDRGRKNNKEWCRVMCEVWVKGRNIYNRMKLWVYRKFLIKIFMINVINLIYLDLWFMMRRKWILNEKNG